MKLAVGAGLAMFLACQGTTPIRKLLDDPGQYDGKTVRIAGTVKTSIGALGFGAYEVEDENHRAEIDRHQRLYDSILKQLQHIDLAKEVGGYDARVITPPVAGKKVRPTPAWLFSGAAFLGLLGGLGLACLRELAVTRG